MQTMLKYGNCLLGYFRFMSHYVNLRVCTPAGNTGLINVSDMLDKMQANPEAYGDTVALSDPNFYQFVRFISESAKRGIKPIHALELTFAAENNIEIQKSEFSSTRVVEKVVTEPYKMLAIALSDEGLKNLSRLNSLMLEATGKADRIPESILAGKPELLEDVVILSGGTRGYLFKIAQEKHLWEQNVSAKTLSHYDERLQEYKNKIKHHMFFWKNICKGNFFVEIQRDGVSDFENQFIRYILPIARQMGIPVVATNHALFLNPEDFSSHRSYIAEKSSIPLLMLSDKSEQAIITATPENYFKSRQEMNELFADIPDALENSYLIAQAANVQVKLNSGNMLPEIKSPIEGENINDYFVRMAAEGLDKVMLTLWNKYCVKGGMVIDKRVKASSYDPDSLPPDAYFAKFKEWQDLNREKNLWELPDSLLLAELKRTRVYAEYKERLDFETNVICRMGFASYFMIVADFIAYSKDNHIPVGPGRGSGAGSLVAFALRITGLDPLEHDLLFERFLNPDRVSMPDFDIDFGIGELRAKVLEYVRNKYNKDGHIHVAGIRAPGTYQINSSIEMAAKAIGISTQHPIVSRIKETIGIKDEKPVDDGDEVYEREEAGKFWDKIGLRDNLSLQALMNTAPLAKEILSSASHLYGEIRNQGIHAAGVVISNSPLEEVIPYDFEGGSTVLTQGDKNDVEALGLVKFDFLGLRNLNLIAFTLDMINQTRNESDKITLEGLANLNLNDSKVFANVFACENTDNVFQFASDGMKKMLKSGFESGKYSFSDLVVFVSMYRPGPIDQIPKFIAIKNGKMQRETLSRYFPEVERLLDETHGILVYQEQVMNVARVMAGFTLAQADNLRRAMGKKKAEEMAKQREIFVENALKIAHDKFLASNYPDKEFDEDAVIEEVEKVFDYMEKFASYGFNKSHAAAYSLISYQTAWLKTYYPNEYMLAVLFDNLYVENGLDSSRKGKMEEIFGNLKDAKRNGVKIHPMDINLSMENFCIREFSVNGEKEKRIVIPFFWKGMPTQLRNSIVGVREKIRAEQGIPKDGKVFSSVDDFIRCMCEHHIAINKDHVSALLYAGAFGKPDNIRYWLNNAEALIKYYTDKQVKVSSSLLKSIPASLLKSTAKQTAAVLNLEEDNHIMTQTELLREQSSLLGFVLNQETLDNFHDKTLHALNQFIRPVYRHTQKRLGMGQEVFEEQFEEHIPFTSLSGSKDELRQEVLEGIQQTLQIKGMGKDFRVSGKSAYVMGYFTYDQKERTPKGDIRKMILRDLNGNEFDLTLRQKWVSEPINLFEMYVLQLDAFVGREFKTGQIKGGVMDEDKLNPIPVDFSLKDIFSIGNIIKQLSHTHSIDWEDTTLDSAEKSALILKHLQHLGLLYEESEESGTKSRKKKVVSNPILTYLPDGNEVFILLGENLIHLPDKMALNVEIPQHSLQLKGIDYRISQTILDGNMNQGLISHDRMRGILKNDLPVFEELQSTPNTLQNWTTIESLTHDFEQLLLVYPTQIRNTKNSSRLLELSDVDGNCRTLFTAKGHHLPLNVGQWYLMKVQVQVMSNGVKINPIDAYTEKEFKEAVQWDKRWIFNDFIKPENKLSLNRSSYSLARSSLISFARKTDTLVHESVNSDYDLKDGEMMISIRYPIHYVQGTAGNLSSFVSEESLIIQQTNETLSRLTEGCVLTRMYDRNQDSLTAYNLLPLHQKYEDSSYYLCQMAYQDFKKHPFNRMANESRGDFQIMPFQKAFMSFKAIYSHYDDTHSSRQDFVALMRLNKLEKVPLKNSKVPFMWKANFSDSAHSYEQVFFKENDILPFKDGIGKSFLLLFSPTFSRSAKYPQGRLFININRVAPLEYLLCQDGTYFLNNPSNEIKLSILQRNTNDINEHSSGKMLRLYVYENGKRSDMGLSMVDTPENRHLLSEWCACQTPVSSLPTGVFYPNLWHSMIKDPKRTPNHYMKVGT